MKRIILALAVVVLAISMQGCIDGFSSIKVIRLGRPVHSLEIDTLTAFGIGADGSSKPITVDWLIEGECALLLDDVGYAASVLATKPGSYFVTVSKGKLIGTAEFDIYLPITEKVVCFSDDSDKRIDMKVGSTCELKAYGFDQYGRQASLEPVWTVTQELGEFTELEDDECYSRVSFTGTKGGIGEVSVADGEASDSIMLVISPYEQLPTTFTITPVSLTIREREGQSFWVTLYDQIGEMMPIEGVIWELTGDIGRINPTSSSITCLFLAEKPGTGTITARHSGFSVSAAITVTDSPEVLE